MKRIFGLSLLCAILLLSCTSCLLGTVLYGGLRLNMEKEQDPGENWDEATPPEVVSPSNTDKFFISGTVIPGYSLGPGGYWIADGSEPPASSVPPVSSEHVHVRKTRGEIREATCGQDGYHPEIVCVKCYQVLEKAKNIPATGDHKGGTATCEEFAQCSVCREYYGEYADHDYTELSCTEDSFCRVCGVVRHVANGHDFWEATCTEDAYCLSCGLKGESAYGHSFTQGFCDRCGAEDPDYAPPSEGGGSTDVKISNFMSLELMNTGIAYRIHDITYNVSGSDLTVTVDIQCHQYNQTGRLKMSYTVYGGGYKRIDEGKFTIDSIAPGERRTVTVTVPGVITSAYSSYKVHIGQDLG